MTHPQPEGYLAAPASGEGAGVLVLHAWWGLNDTIKGVCDRLAEQGFVAFAPDLYHGKVAKTIPEAEAQSGALESNYQQVKVEVAEAAHFLSERVGGGAISVVAFSMGVYYALSLSIRDPEIVRRVVTFYGSADGDYSPSKSAYLCHFAENDPYEPLSNVEHMADVLKAAGRPAEIYTYPGTGHWFFEPDRMDAYNPAAASLAWERTLAFLK